MISGPLSPSDRITSIDVLRGLALLGIVIVNAAYFGLPLGGVLDGGIGAGSMSDRVTAILVVVFAEVKFISIFSILFGFGLAMQRSRRLAANTGFAAFGVRRMLLLAVFGLLHVLTLWYGDVLFLYAGLGLLLIPMLCLDASVRLVLAAVMICGAGVFVGLLSLLGMMGPPIVDPSTVDGSLRGFDAILEAQGDPTRPVWIDAEVAAFRNGPFLDALTFRISSWALGQIISIFGFAWHVLGMALIGSWMHDRDFFGAGGSVLRRRMTFTVLPGGLLLSIAAGMIFWVEGKASIPGAVATLIQNLSAVMIALGLVSLISLRVDAGRMPLSRIFSAVGRMSLTAYLLESVVFSALMLHWGLGWFDQISRTGLVGLSLLVYTAVALFCLLWSRRFAMGPMEWLWRQGAYLGTRRPA
ncbi:MAG: hypothetical protein CMJ51_04520 [Planctomycetaceae bacterium]|nr:hypothetical protein [Planctomycetaceae bacterium]MAD78619.1 hypothetical protein [Planctomycetaceae bacterium]